MNYESITYKKEDIYPEKALVFEAMGISKDAEIPDEIEDLYLRSFELFSTLISPKGILREIPKSDFDKIYEGEGMNDPTTPLPEIYPKAAQLALYVFTLGMEISCHIDQLFKEKDYPLGFMLDRIASESADKASMKAEKLLSSESIEENTSLVDLKTLLYSPGYCGWHISSQKKIFEYLSPQQIGVTLNESFLMTPIKSVSGILVAGEKEIHQFKNNYNFCKDCTTFTCRDRMKR